MNLPELAFRSLSVRHMPGFEDEGFKLDDLEPCINIVTGRNASGKTTAARALGLLLWPSDEHAWHAGRAEVSGEVVLQGKEWTLEVRNGQVNYLQEGIRKDHFPAPAEQTRDRYNLALHELIRSDDDAFAERIMRESAGGYDLDEAARSLGYTDGIRNKNVTEYRNYRESREALYDVQGKQQELKEEERRLEELKTRRREAREAGRRADLLELAVAFKEAEKELAAREAALEQYPEGVEKASGEEFERIQSLTDEIDEAKTRRAAALEKKESARAAIESLVIPSDGVDESVVESLSKQMETIEDLERRISRRQEEREEYGGEARQILQDLHPELVVEDWLAIDLDGVNQLDQFARNSDTVRGEKKAIEAMEKWLGIPEENPETEKLHAGASLLRTWLRETESGSSSGISFWMALAAVLATIVAGILARFFGITGWLFLIVPGGILGYGWWLRYSSSEDVSRADMRKTDYERMELEQPEAWTIDDVEELVTRLTDRFAEAKVEEERWRRWQALQEDREELEKERERLAREREVIEDRVGPVPFADGDTPLAYFLQKVQRFQQKMERMSGTEDRIAELERQLSTVLEKVNEGLRAFDHPEVSGAEQAKQAIRKVQREHREWTEASRELNDAREAIRAAEEAVAGKSAERAQIYDKLCIDEGEIDSVKEFMQQVEPYEEDDKKVYNARSRVNETRAALQAHELYVPEIEELSRTELQDKLDARRAEFEKLTEIDREISRIETLVDEHQNQHDLERALARRDRCLEALDRLREENLRALVGDTLVETIKDKTRYQSRPAVFRTADQLFGQITGGRYRLVLGGTDRAAFQARDVREDRMYSLEELSSGTKIQLLLAVRMAFVESQEQTVKFPLFVDEVLANSDDVRARAIIDALVEICEEGRQIFYFTAQSDEVHKWRQILEDRNIQYSVRSLSDADTVSAADYRSADGISVDLVYPVTPPDGQSHDTYGEQLNVPRFRVLVDSVDKLHLWYLIEDTALLHACLARGIDSWGPLKTYLDCGGRIPGYGKDRLDRVREKAEIVEEVLRHYRRGRAKPVPPRELQQTGAVTDNFIDEVTKLLQEVDGNPERLIQGLKNGRVSGFRTTKREELETYLEEQGYIDPDDVMPEKELQAQIQAIVSRYPDIDTSEIERLLERVLDS